MTEHNHLADCPKFTLILKSHTRKKRLLEAKTELMDMYPFEVCERNILLVKTKLKGQYDIYISRDEILYEKNVKKAILIILICCVIAGILVLTIQRAAVKKIEDAEQLKKIEKIKLEEEQARKAKLEKLEKLQAEYSKNKQSEYEKVYPYIERIYSAVTSKATIENVYIEGNTFTVELTAKDTAGILSNFEQGSAFCSIKMNRTKIKDGKETVTYTGEFAKSIKAPDEKLSVEEKIDFYSAEISRMNRRTKDKQSKRLSEYIKNIRNVLHKNNCHEQYIQLRGNADSAEVEFYILSSSKNILTFINAIQSGQENLTDIKSLRIYNTPENNRIQTTVCFDTGIELKKDDSMIAEYADKKIEVSEIDRIFYKSPVPKTSSVQHAARTSGLQNTVPRKVSILHRNLAYIGITKSNGVTLVLAKDEDMGSIYKFVLTDSETGGDYCIRTEKGFSAKLRGEYYEVNR